MIASRSADFAVMAVTIALATVFAAGQARAQPAWKPDQDNAGVRTFLTELGLAK